MRPWARTGSSTVLLSARSRGSGWLAPLLRCQLAGEFFRQRWRCPLLRLPRCLQCAATNSGSCSRGIASIDPGDQLRAPLHRESVPLLACSECHGCRQENRRAETVRSGRRMLGLRSPASLMLACGASPSSFRCRCSPASACWHCPTPRAVQFAMPFPRVMEAGSGHLAPGGPATSEEYLPCPE